MVQVDVYGDLRATCTQRVIVLLEELDLKYDVKQINLSKGEQKSKEFLELQPFGKVPVVKYDDRVLFESRSILRYIAKNNTESPIVQIKLMVKISVNNLVLSANWFCNLAISLIP